MWERASQLNSFRYVKEERKNKSFVYLRIFNHIFKIYRSAQHTAHASYLLWFSAFVEFYILFYFYDDSQRDVLNAFVLFFFFFWRQSSGVIVWSSVYGIASSQPMGSFCLYSTFTWCSFLRQNNVPDKAIFVHSTGEHRRRLLKAHNKLY